MLGSVIPIYSFYQIETITLNAEWRFAKYIERAFGTNVSTCKLVSEPAFFSDRICKYAVSWRSIVLVSSVVQQKLHCPGPRAVAFTALVPVLLPSKAVSNFWISINLLFFLLKTNKFLKSIGIDLEKCVYIIT